MKPTKNKTEDLFKIHFIETEETTEQTNEPKASESERSEGASESERSEKQTNEPKASESERMKELPESISEVYGDTKRKLGMGNYGDVWETELGYAVKILKGDAVWSGIVENSCTRSIDSPYCIRPEATLMQENTMYIVYPLGESVTIPSSNPLQDFAEIVRGAIDIHESNIYHTDFKMANVIRLNGRMTIIDFGTAEFQVLFRKIRKPAYTIYWRAPEILFGGTISRASEVWALGVVLYELLTGQPPFKGDSDFDQIVKISCNLGTPAAENWPGYESLPYSGFCRQRSCPGDKSYLKGIQDPQVRDLFERIFVYDSTKRITCFEILSHPALAGTKLLPAPPLATGARQFLRNTEFAPHFSQLCLTPRPDTLELTPRPDTLELSQPCFTRHLNSEILMTLDWAVSLIDDFEVSRIVIETAIMIFRWMLHLEPPKEKYRLYILAGICIGVSLYESFIPDTFTVAHYNRFRFNSDDILEAVRMIMKELSFCPNFMNPLIYAFAHLKPDYEINKGKLLLAEELVLSTSLAISLSAEDLGILMVDAALELEEDLSLPEPLLAVIETDSQIWKRNRRAPRSSPNEGGKRKRENDRTTGDGVERSEGVECDEIRV